MFHRITGPPPMTKSSPKTQGRPLETVAEATTSALPTVTVTAAPTPAEVEPCTRFNSACFPAKINGIFVLNQ